MKRDILNSPHLQAISRRRTRVFWNKFFIGIIILILLFIMLALASRAESINIKKIEIIGGKTISSGVIEENINQELSGYYLWVFPKTNFFLYPKGKLMEKIASDFKLLKDIEISLKEGGVLRISFVERTPVSTWCGNNLPISGASFEDRECYFLDEDGFIFDKAPYFSGNVYFRFFGKIKEEGKDAIGLSYFPEIWATLGSFRETLAEMNLRPFSIFIKEDGDVEVYLTSHALPPNSQKIILKKDANFESVIGNLHSALETEPLKTDFKENYENLEYLDLRFGNKVFFKFK